MKPSKRHLRNSNLMMEFRNAYVVLTNHARPVSDGWSLARLEPNGIAEAEWSRLYFETAKAAGAAALAYPKYGGTFTLRNAAYILNNVDPVANWEMSIRDPEQTRPKDDHRLDRSCDFSCSAGVTGRD